MSQILSRSQSIKFPWSYHWSLMNAELLPPNTALLQSPCFFRHSHRTTTMLFLINVVESKYLSQPNIFEGLFSLGKWWTIESKCCVGTCWFTLSLKKKLSSLKCILCVLVKIDDVALKSEIFWFNRNISFNEKSVFWTIYKCLILSWFRIVLCCHCNGRSSCSTDNQSSGNSKSCFFFFTSFNLICSCSPAAECALSKCQVMQLSFTSLQAILNWPEISRWSLRIHVYVFLRVTAEPLIFSTSLASQSPSLVPNSDTYSNSEDWLSRFVGIKMQNQVHTRHWLHHSLGGTTQQETSQDFCRKQAHENGRKISGWSNCIVRPLKMSSLYTTVHLALIIPPPFWNEKFYRVIFSSPRRPCTPQLQMYQGIQQPLGQPLPFRPCLCCYCDSHFWGLPQSCHCLLASLTSIWLLFEGDPTMRRQHLNSAGLRGTEYLPESHERERGQKEHLPMLQRTWTCTCLPGWGRMEKSKLHSIACSVREAPCKGTCRKIYEKR